MAWGNSFDSATAINQIWQAAQVNLVKEIDLTANVIFTETKIENGEIKQRIVPPEEIYNNIPPTHDPYVNPNAHIYYECACGDILDPQTKSFAALNNCASAKGWKVRFGEQGYTPYCVKCGEDVE